MKKKIFSIILVLFVAFIIFSDKVCAWYAPSGNNTALVVGASYSDGRNSAEHSNNTYSTYQSMGLTSKKFFNPAIGDLKGKHFPAVSYLESGIIYFSGHGNNHNMNYNTFDISDCSHNGDNYIGIGSYNNSKTAFIEYAGCKTAEGSSNITEYSQYVGVNITMGWTTDLYEDSFKNWNKRFNNKIKDKATSVDSAAKSASNYIYVHNEVKNYKVYGYGDTNPWYWIYGNSSSKSKSQTGQVYNNGYNLESKNGKSFYLLDNQEELDTKVDNFINNEIGSSFNRDNYKLEINGNDVKYFDYVLYYDDIRTNLGYTVSVDKTGITKLYDNMNGLEEKDALNTISNVSGRYNKIDKISYRAKIINENRNKKEIKNISDEIKFYDFESSKPYYIFNVRSVIDDAEAYYGYQKEV